MYMFLYSLTCIANALYDIRHTRTHSPSRSLQAYDDDGDDDDDDDDDDGDAWSYACVLRHTLAYYVIECNNGYRPQAVLLMMIYL